MLYISQLLTLVYAISVMVGGVIGYIQAKSVPSIVMGISFCILLMISTTLWMRKIESAFTVTVGLTLFLALFFLFRFSLSGSFFPSGLMTLVSITIFCLQYFGQNSKQFY
jgi:uncharacterized membrane protein (UPF0136 family)